MVDVVVIVVIEKGHMKNFVALRGEMIVRLFIVVRGISSVLKARLDSN